MRMFNQLNNEKSFHFHISNLRKLFSACLIIVTKGIFRGMSR